MSFWWMAMRTRRSCIMRSIDTRTEIPCGYLDHHAENEWSDWVFFLHNWKVAYVFPVSPMMHHKEQNLIVDLGLPHLYLVDTHRYCLHRIWWQLSHQYVIESFHTVPAPPFPTFLMIVYRLVISVLYLLLLMSEVLRHGRRMKTTKQMSCVTVINYVFRFTSKNICLIHLSRHIQSMFDATRNGFYTIELHTTKMAYLLMFHWNIKVRIPTNYDGIKRHKSAEVIISQQWLSACEWS